MSLEKQHTLSCTECSGWRRRHPYLFAATKMPDIAIVCRNASFQSFPAAAMSDNYPEERCTSIKKQILSLMKERSFSEDACVVVREIFLTSRCSPDSLTHVRDAYTKEIGLDTVTNLVAKKPLDDNEVTAVAYAMGHYSQWTYSEVCASLPWRERVVQRLYDYSTPLLAVVGIVSVGSKVAQSTLRFVRGGVRKKKS